MRKKQLSVLLGTVMVSASVMMSCMAAETDAVENAAAAESAAEAAAPEEAAAAEEEAPEAEEIPQEIAEETVEETEELADPSFEADALAAADRKSSKKASAGDNLADKDGLIEDDGTVVSNSIEGEPEMPLEEMWDDQMHNREFPGFEVDPSRYPAANITENAIELYRFLTDRMELNHAAACGVLANVQLESNFRPLALGDSGTSYGVCQWHNGRFTNLMNYCKSHDLDYNTLEGQISYLEWELTHGYKGVYQMLKKIEDTREGAYEAGYLFCYRFELPDQVEARSKRRGNLAREEYYDKDFDLLEWQLKHDALFKNDEWLQTLTEVETDQVPEYRSVEGEAMPEEALPADEQETAVEMAQEMLPQWQSALGEPSALL